MSRAEVEAALAAAFGQRVNQLFDALCSTGDDATALSRFALGLGKAIDHYNSAVDIVHNMYEDTVRSPA